jgi:hypothetical protein
MEDPSNGLIGVTSGARCSPKAGIHLRPIAGRSCEKAVLMGVLVEAGGGYRAKLFATHPKATKQIRVDTLGRAKPFVAHPKATMQTRVDTRGRAQRPAHTDKRAKPH